MDDLRLATLADAFYNHPTRKLKTIGITATNGKTSTSFMTNAILENHGLKTGLNGNSCSENWRLCRAF